MNSAPRFSIADGCGRALTPRPCKNSMTPAIARSSKKTGKAMKRSSGFMVDRLVAAAAGTAQFAARSAGSRTGRARRPGRGRAHGEYRQLLIELGACAFGTL